MIITFDGLIDQILHDLMCVVSIQDYPELCNTFLTMDYSYCSVVLAEDARVGAVKILSNLKELYTKMFKVATKQTQ